MSDESSSGSSSKSKKSWQSKSWQSKSWQSKAIGIGILVLVVGYVLLRPSLEEWLGVPLPSLTESNEQVDPDNADPAPRLSPTTEPRTQPQDSAGNREDEPLLRELKDGGAILASGLMFPGSRSGETRLEHVLRHDNDLPRRSGMHGVFDGDETDLLEVVNEAYELILSKSNKVTSKKEGERTVYDVDLQRRIGFVGGRVGAERSNPEARKIRLVLEGNRVITAFPIK
ncbi:MAG: hypothetical protein ACI9G1_000591 [Pirellulaceae bacterium]|jgi:hypothetical protein